MNYVDASRCKAVREVLCRDKLDTRPFVLLAYATVWLCPEWEYADILAVYAEYVGDAPERVHADLCRRLLAAGMEIGPAQYLAEVGNEVKRIEDRISTEQGSGASTVSTHAGEQACHACSPGNRAAY